jgi:hypothetical protein
MGTMSKNYIPVLCCSSKKTKDRFYYNGQPIKFVASLSKAPRDVAKYCRPDDKIIPGETRTWRDLVLEQKHPDLVQAYCLYKHKVYRDLYREFGNRFYILSGGWGIIRANFKLPDYNITYSTAPNMPEYARRRDNIGWNDINHLKEDAENKTFDSDSIIVLFAGADYAPPFCDMTQSIPNRKKILYKSQNIMRRQGFEYIYYDTNRITTWFYEAAGEFILNPGKVAGI